MGFPARLAPPLDNSHERLERNRKLDDPQRSEASSQWNPTLKAIPINRRVLGQSRIDVSDEGGVESAIFLVAEGNSDGRDRESWFSERRQRTGVDVVDRDAGRHPIAGANARIDHLNLGAVKNLTSVPIATLIFSFR